MITSISSGRRNDGTGSSILPSGTGGSLAAATVETLLLPWWSVEASGRRRGRRAGFFDDTTGTRGIVARGERPGQGRAVVLSRRWCHHSRSATVGTDVVVRTVACALAMNCGHHSTSPFTMVATQICSHRRGKGQRARWGTTPAVVVAVVCWRQQLVLFLYLSH